jgi:uncharacterized protein DUF4314
MDDIDQDALSPSLSWLQGRRVRLVRCADPHTRLRSGAMGFVTIVDGLNTVHVAWDDGSRLGLIPDIDEWEIDDVDG